MNSEIKVLIAELDKLRAEYVRNTFDLSPEKKSKREFVGEIAELTMALHKKSMECIGTPLSSLGFFRSSVAAREMLLENASDLYDLGYLGDLFCIHPYPQIFSDLIFKAISGEEQMCSLLIDEVVLLGGHLFENNVGIIEETGLSPCIMMKIAQNIVDHMEVAETEEGMVYWLKYDICQKSIIRILRYIEKIGLHDEVMLFFKRNDEKLHEMSRFVPCNPTGVIGLFLSQSRNSKLSALIREYLPSRYESILDSKVIQNHVWHNIGCASFKLSETTYLDVMRAEDFVESCVIRLSKTSLHKSYLETDKAFQAYGKGSLFQAMHAHEPIFAMREKALSISSRILERGLTNLYEVISSGEVRDLNRYIMLDFVARDRGDWIMATPYLQDAWASHVLRCVHEFSVDEVAVGPMQCEAILEKMAEWRISPKDIPDRFTDSDVFKERISNAPLDIGIRIINVYSEWDYLDGISFSDRGIQRHKLSLDMGL